MKRIKLFEEFKEGDFYYYLITLDSFREHYVFCEVEKSLADDFEYGLENFTDITIFSYDNVGDDWDYFLNYCTKNKIMPIETYTIEKKSEISKTITKIWYKLPTK
jgi:hypothetical protein